MVVLALKDKPRAITTRQKRYQECEAAITPRVSGAEMGIRGGMMLLPEVVGCGGRNFLGKDGVGRKGVGEEEWGM